MAVMVQPQPRPEMSLRISARTDYAVRAVAELAAGAGGLVKGEQISAAQGIPLKFLLNIMTDLRHARIVRSHRGSEGGFQLARAPENITVADVIRAVEGSIPTIQNAHPDELRYSGPAEALREVWLAVQATLESLLGAVSLADLASGSLPPSIRAMAASVIC